MDQKQIEKLMAVMDEKRIKRVVLKKEGFEIEIERETASPAPYHPPQPPIAYAHAPVAESKAPSIDQVREADRKGKETTGLFVTSPMVGTFYAAPSPEDAPFIKVGDTVSENTIVCIIEAMKVMNEVKAGMKGTVVEILSRSGDPVEFGTRIFRIEPA